MDKNIKNIIKGLINNYFGSNCNYFLTCRFTHIYSDGPAIYYTLIIDPRRCGDFVKYYDKKNNGGLRNGENAVMYLERLLKIWDEMKSIITKTVVKYGGSITHHHAVGADTAMEYINEVGIRNIEWMVELKKHFDPKWICNPGVVVPYFPDKMRYDVRKERKDVMECSEIERECPKGFVPGYIGIPSKL